MSDGSNHQNEQITMINAEQSENEYKYGDIVIAQSGKKSRGGLKSMSELLKPGVEVVGGEILAPTFKSKVTLTIDSFTFNSACVQLFNNTQYIEMIIDKPEQRLIVLPSTPIPKESVKFALVKDNNNKPRKTVAKKFCALLYHYMQWSTGSRYHIMALYQKLEGQELLVFNLDEAVEVQNTTIITDDGKKKISREYYLPVMFKESFGFNYSELEERKKVDLNDIFLFIDPKTAQTHSRTIEPKIPDAEDIIKSNYRQSSENPGGDGNG